MQGQRNWKEGKINNCATKEEQRSPTSESQYIGMYLILEGNTIGQLNAFLPTLFSGFGWFLVKLVLL